MPEKTYPIRFTAEHMRLFSAASGDVNQLHISERYAATTIFGRPVVFGCLAAVGCLAQAEIPAGCGIVGMEVLFLRPVFAEVDYSLVLSQDSSDTIAWRLQDGKMPLLSGSAKVAAVGVAPEARERCWRAEPRQWADGAIVAGLECEGGYAPDPESFRRLWQTLGAKSELNSMAAWLLLFGSYFTGMEIPGAEALFHSYTFAIDDPNQGGRLHFSAKVRSFKPKLRLASTVVQLSRDGVPVASGTMTAFVRRERPRSTNEAITKLLPASDKLRGKVALITGASRGLGAAIARALALQGCTVIVNYRNST